MDVLLETRWFSAAPPYIAARCTPETASNSQMENGDMVLAPTQLGMQAPAKSRFQSCGMDRGPCCRIEWGAQKGSFKRTVVDRGPP